ncbi:hypothetical protein [Roseivivax sp. CAU 1761]
MIFRIKTSAGFGRPFELNGLVGTIPPGEYTIHVKIDDSQTFIEQITQINLSPSSGLRLQSGSTSMRPAMTQIETKCKPFGQALSSDILEEVLTDPMVCLILDPDIITNDTPQVYHYAPEISECDTKPVTQILHEEGVWIAR